MNKLMPFQVDGVKALEQFQGRALLADDMGLGKTIQGLYWLGKHEDAFPAVVVCPSYLKLNWKDEAHKWLPSRSSLILDGCKARRLPKADIYIINYDILQRRKQSAKCWLNQLKKQKLSTLLVDEAHMIKSASALRSKAVKALSKACRHIILMTGTPIENRTYELWFLINLVCPGLFKSQFRFGMEYCNGHHNGFGFVFKGCKKPKQLNRILLENLMIRRRKEDVLKDLPKKRRQAVSIVMDAKHTREYRKIKTAFIQWLMSSGADTKTIARKRRAEALVKFGELSRVSGLGKVAAVTDWVVDTLESEPAVVLFTMRRNVAKLLVRDLKKKNITARTILGDTPKVKRHARVRAFQKGKLQVLVGTFGAMGTGVTLTKACHVGIVQFPWSPGKLDQGEDRLHRIGQKRPVWVHYFIASDTVDENMMEGLDAKRKSIKRVLDGVKVKDTDLLTNMLKGMLR